MPTYILKAPNGQEVEATGDHYPSLDEKAAFFSALGLNAPDNPTPGPSKPTSGGAAAAELGRGIMLGGAQELATNPKVPAAAAKIGRAIGGVAPLVVGAHKGGTVGALAGIAAAAEGAWAGGGTGWFTGKLAQGLAGPASRALEAAAPVTNAALMTDLAQVAEPDRIDIGTLGVGAKADILKDPKAVARVIKASPSIGDAVLALTELGMPQTTAIRTVMNYHINGK